MKVLRYKNYIGSIEVSIEDQCLHGQLLYINDMVTYEAKTVDALDKKFKEAVDDYLVTCEKLKREPLKPFKGSLNVRIGSELHKESAIQAAILGLTLNEYIKLALKNQLLRRVSRGRNKKVASRPR
ncbi:MAG: type II toxin-antitoxin system HicB family antitoxin [Gammaproteobacteria bacterium]